MIPMNKMVKVEIFIWNVTSVNANVNNGIIIKHFFLYNLLYKTILTHLSEIHRSHAKITIKIPY